jgi:hypothetical protein
MKNLIFIILCIPCFWSCTDECTQTITQRVSVPFQVTQAQLENGIGLSTPQDLKYPGKIYYHEGLLLINEIKKGIHLIDNSNPSSPQKISFLKIPGVLDMAIKGEILYADSYTDLVALDISDLKNIKEVGRIKNQFNNGMVDGNSWYFDPSSKVITDFEYKLETQRVKTNCGYAVNPWNSFYRGDIAFKGGSSAQTGSSTSSSNAGIGGSMARFTLYDDYLYAATQSELMVFDIKTPTKPDSINKIPLGWGIETIFPYGDKLFIGSNTGMYIFENKNPSKPQLLSIFQHVRACDPVVVSGTKAYVTLRDGWCGLAPNRLDVVDISNLTSPFLLKSYNLQNPHGLSIFQNKLMVCEGKYGLKSYDVSNAMDIKLKQHLKDVDAFDVIQIDRNLLIMIGKDGLYQYDNSDPKNLKLLSKIEVKP